MLPLSLPRRPLPRRRARTPGDISLRSKRSLQPRKATSALCSAIRILIPHSTAGTSTRKFGAFTTGRREVASSFTRFFTVYRKNKILPANGPGLAALCGVRPKTVPPSPATGSNLWVPFSLTLLTDAYGKVGKPGEGLACLDDAACSIEVTQKHSTEAELCKIRGELLSIVA